MAKKVVIKYTCAYEKKLVQTYLEGVMQTMRINLSEGCLIGICNEFLHLGENIAMEVKVELWLLSTDDFREVLPAQLVTIFELSIVLSLLLDSIVRQVD